MAMTERAPALLRGAVLGALLLAALGSHGLRAQDAATPPQAVASQPVKAGPLSRAELVQCANLEVQAQEASLALQARQAAIQGEEDALHQQQDALNTAVGAYNHAKKRNSQDATALKQQSLAYRRAVDQYNTTTLGEQATMVKAFNAQIAVVNQTCRTRKFPLEDALVLNPAQRAAMGVTDALAQVEKQQRDRAALANALPDKEGWIAVDISEGVVRVPVKINGIVATAMIDSGAEIDGISEDFVAQHRDGLAFTGEVRLRSVFTAEEKPLIDNVQVSVFGAQLHMHDLTPVRSHEFQLLLGAPFLRLFVLQIDYPNQRIRFLNRDNVSLKKVANVPMARSDDSALPMVRVSVAPKQDIWLTLDTGNSGGLFLTRKYAASTGMLAAYQASAHTTQGANGAGNVDSFHIPYFKIGPFELENVEVSVPAEHQTSSIGEKYAGSILYMGRTSKGLLGYDILKHFVVTLDYSNAEVHLGVPESPKPPG